MEKIRRILWGIGNPIRSDDGAGVRVARRLAAAPPSGMRIVVCETMPENYLAELRDDPPDLLLVVDAAEMGLPPGSLRLFTLDDAQGITWNSHDLPLSTLLAPFRGAFPVLLIGIQPFSTTLGTSLSPIMKGATDALVRIITEERWHEIPRLAS